MWFPSVLHRFQGASKSVPRGRGAGPRRRPRPAVEELEPRLTPAEVGLNDFRISHMGPDGDASYSALNPAVAYNPTNNEYLVVWQGEDNTAPLGQYETEIFGQRVSAATGALLGGRIRVSDMGPDGDVNYGAYSTAVAYNPTDNEYLVVWYGDDKTDMLVDNEYEIFGQRLNAATGAQVGNNDFRISDMGPDRVTTYGAFNPKVAYNGTNNQYLVVWTGDDNTELLVNDEFEIFGQRLDAHTGTEIGADFRLSDMGNDGNANYDAFEPAVAYNPAGNEYLVVWRGDTAFTGDLADNEFEIFGQRLNADPLAFGEVGANDFRISDMGGLDGDARFGAFDPAVVYNGAANEYLVAWRGDDNTALLVDNEYEVFGQRLDAATGAEVGLNDFRLSDMGPDGNANFDAFAPAVAYSGAANEYLIVWSGDDNTAPLVDNEYEVFGQRLAATGAEVGANDFRLSDVGPDGDPAFGAFARAVAYNGAGNEYLVVWTGDDNTGGLVDGEYEIFGQRVSPPDPPPPPPSPPPGPPQIAAEAFRRKGVARVRVRDAATGAVRGVLTPFKGYRGRLRLALRDLNGDGSLDLIVQALVRGKRKRKAYDAATLAPLPPGPP